MQIAADTRERYFEAAGERAGELRRVDAFIREHAPALEPVVSSAMGSGAMLGYGERPYRNKSSKEPTTWPLVALAAQKRHLSLYVSVVVDGEYLAEAWADRLGKVSCGKSCIRFTKVDKLNLDALAELLSEVNRRFIAGEKLFGI